MDANQLIDIARTVLAVADSEVVAGYVFGSVARGEAGPTSDLDVGVLRRGGRGAVASRSPGQELASLTRLDELRDRLERAIRDQGRSTRVDLVPLDRASPDFMHNVFQHHVLVLDRDPESRVEFELQARQEYLDIRPFLLRFRQHKLDSA